MTWEQLRIRLMGLSAYRPLLETEELGACAALLEALYGRDGERAAACYTKLFCLLRQGNWSSLVDWTLDQLKYRETPYPILLAERREDPALAAAFLRGKRAQESSPGMKALSRVAGRLEGEAIPLPEL